MATFSKDSTPNPPQGDDASSASGQLLNFAGHTCWPDIYEELQLYILSIMSLVSAVSIGCTSRTNYNLVQAHLWWRVQSCLRAFNLPEKSTLSTMKRIGAIISGSAALAVIEPGMFIPQDIDIYVPFGRLEDFVSFIKSLGDFRETVKDDNEPSYQYSGRQTGIHTVKYFTHKADGAIVNVVETRSSSTPTAVFMFHSTIVMNYVTWSTIVCAYPRMTTQHKALINSDANPPTSKTLYCLIKYMARGFDFLGHANEWDKQHDCRSNGSCGRTIRGITDKATLRTAFSGGFMEEQDVVDNSLIWILASAAPCKDDDAVPHTLGFVGTNHFAAVVSDRAQTA
ncbi:hypothetical protein EST38_g10655 [Candolleomyces aberdarensis]|uniref:Uncharacterized protein n=1 Tax=Candolleomyces aberdarensis TaxID=2316362 RepID=A0A4Q2D6T8_9AGAR|nr:hypothetical protein EST38_g10655 [Candolleomyces aberdarensis]